jgi:hypothetical protein
MAYKPVKMGGTMIKAGCETGGNMMPKFSSRGKMPMRRTFSPSDSTDTQPHIRSNSARRSYTSGSRY